MHPYSNSHPKKSIGQFLTGIKEILHEKGRWLYAIFAIGGICMFASFGILFHLSETLEAKYKLYGASKVFVLAIPLALLCLAFYGSGKIIGKNKVLMKWLGFSGMALLPAAMLITGFSQNIYFMVGFLSLGGIGIGVVLPCMDTLITEGIQKEN
nr:MFS transporter [Paenibacillus etheri]